MNRTLFFVVSILFIFSQHLYAQHKSTFAIGADYVTYANPREMYAPHVEVSNKVASVDFFDQKVGLWMAYFYKDKYSIRAYRSYMQKNASYEAGYTVPANFLEGRSATFYDLTIGYNVLHKLNKIGCWIYGGASYINRFDDGRITYIPGWWDAVGGGRQARHIVRPVVQVLFKYNPIKYVFIGVGGTCHYIFADTQPFSLNLSLGLEI